MSVSPSLARHISVHCVPDRLKQSLMFLDRLHGSGVFQQASERFWVARRPGGTITDALTYLVAYFAAPGSLWGLRGFYLDNADWNRVLAAAAGRARLMSPSSLSRFLGVVPTQELATFGSWLLREGSGALDLLRSPHVQSRDGRGNYWHILDFDPTRTAVRERALLEDPAFPQGQRRLAELCVPGHFGRKRGERGRSEHVLEHHGAGVVLQTTTHPGNGSAHLQFQAALSAAVELGNALGHPLARIVVRADGEFGQIPFVADAQTAGVSLITRCSRYAAVLSDSELRRRLRAARWERVPDSGSGPRRHALDLGVVALGAAEPTLRADGTPHEPITVRLVASRYAETSHLGVGHSIDGERLELFMTLGIDAGAWSAADVVATYYGRIAQENRFAQMDHESHSQLCSQSVGGEHLARMVAALVWNLRIVEGERLNPISSASPPMQVGREPTMVDLTPLALAEMSASEGASGEPPIHHAEPPSVDAVLAAIDIDGQAKARQMTWDPTTRTVTREGATYKLARPEHRGHRLRLRFATVGSRARKRVDFDIHRADADRLFQAWNLEARRTGRAPLRIPEIPPVVRVLAEVHVEAPVAVPCHAAFLPAIARHALARHLHAHNMLVTISIEPADPITSRHPMVEYDIRRRRHQRFSRAEQAARNARPPGVELRVAISNRLPPGIPIF